MHGSTFWKFRKINSGRQIKEMQKSKYHWTDDEFSYVLALKPCGPHKMTTETQNAQKKPYNSFSRKEKFLCSKSTEIYLPFCSLTSQPPHNPEVPPTKAYMNQNSEGWAFSTADQWCCGPRKVKQNPIAFSMLRLLPLNSRHRHSHERAQQYR